MLKFAKELVVWALWIGLSAAATLALNSFVLLNAQVVTGSMESTIMTHNRVFGLRFFDDISRGDIVVFDSPLPAQFSEPFIKRVIGLPGEKVAVVDGVLYINDAPMPESYVSHAGRDFAPIVVPYGHYFVMGDNRDFSRDSREWGAICEGSIIGKIHIIFAP